MVSGPTAAIRLRRQAVLWRFQHLIALSMLVVAFVPVGLDGLRALVDAWSTVEVRYLGHTQIADFSLWPSSTVSLGHPKPYLVSFSIVNRGGAELHGAGPPEELHADARNPRIVF